MGNTGGPQLLDQKISKTQDPPMKGKTLKQFDTHNSKLQFDTHTKTTSFTSAQRTGVENVLSAGLAYPGPQTGGQRTHTHSHSRQTANTSFPSIRKYPRRAQYKIAGGVTKKHFLFPAVLLPPRDPGRPPNNGILTDFVFQRSNRSMCLGGHTHPNTIGKR